MVHACMLGCMECSEDGVLMDGSPVPPGSRIPAGINAVCTCVGAHGAAECAARSNVCQSGAPDATSLRV